jgi:hypothetical protein
VMFVAKTTSTSDFCVVFSALPVNVTEKRRVYQRSLRLFCFISSMQILCDKFPDFVRRICGSSMRRGVAVGPSAATSSQFVARRRLAAETAPRTGISPRACV